MKNYVQPGESITLTAAAAATSGDGVLVGSLFGIASGDAAIGETLVLTTKGVFTMPKVSTDVMAVGDVVYWDDSAGLVTTDDDTGNNPRVGLAVTAAGNPSGTVNVRLDGYDNDPASFDLQTVGRGTGGESRPLRRAGRVRGRSRAGWNDPSYGGGNTGRVAICDDAV